MNLSTQVFVSAFCVSSCAGLAALLRSGRPLTVVLVVSALLNSGLLGLGISLLWYTRFIENLYCLVGVCVIVGLGGMTSVDLALALLRKAISTKVGDVKDEEAKNEKV